MEKILLIINAHKPDVYSIDFACKMAALTDSKLTGLFVENVYLEYVPAAGMEAPVYFSVVNEEADTAVKTDTDQAVRIFKDECLLKGIKPEIYIEKGEPIQEIIFESRFADLIIIDPDISFYEKEEQLPSHFVKEILANAECPVLLAPEKYEAIQEIVFCYDGSPSSVFAIKQFTSLLPEFRNRKIMLLEVNKSSNKEFTESDRRIMEWLRAHYPSVCYHALKGDVKDALFTYFFMKKNKLIVMGAYGRSILSNFFKKSNADILIRTVDLPLFITHH